MSIQLIRYELFDNAITSTAQKKPFIIRVWVDFHRHEKRYDITVKPNAFAPDCALLRPSVDFYRDFPNEPGTVEQVAQAVGRAIHGELIELPKQFGEKSENWPNGRVQPTINPRKNRAAHK